MEAMLIDSRGMMVADVLLPSMPPTPKIILYKEQVYLMETEGRIFRAAPFYIAGGASQALFDETGALVFPEKLGHDANPFGRANYAKEKTERRRRGDE